jgi:2,4-dienoyl-CoA reductase-like NADH-dependent reductase (Old Yellow Enzyme family)
VAVRHDGRANPNQMVINSENLSELESLRAELITTHETEFGTTADLVIGLQLTHSGRFAKPDFHDRMQPRTAQRNVLLDSRCGITDDSALFSDDEITVLIEDFVRAACLAEQAGFRFVDIKHCHGYLGHELLSGFDRPGKYGGSFENRTRFLREIVEGIRSRTSSLEIGVRVSVFDFLPFTPGMDGVGIPEQNGDSRLIFGADSTGIGIDLHEPTKFLSLLESLGIKLVCTTAGSPYYNPHILRPALFPPSDGYKPPEDPLVGVFRQIMATAELKQRHPDLIFIGSGYSYLQEWLPHVSQEVVQSKWVDFIGLGRMVLSYPELPADVLAGRPMSRKKVCRTFSDCTTSARKGMVSGCYPLDPFYKQRNKFFR